MDTTPVAYQEARVKISSRNRLKDKAVEELGLEAGQEAYAIIEASDVMVGHDG
jgi:molybdopterin-binding protein